MGQFLTGELLLPGFHCSVNNRLQQPLVLLHVNPLMCYIENNCQNNNTRSLTSPQNSMEVTRSFKLRPSISHTAMVKHIWNGCIKDEMDLWARCRKKRFGRCSPVWCQVDTMGKLFVQLCHLFLGLCVGPGEAECKVAGATLDVRKAVREAEDELPIHCLKSNICNASDRS